MFEARAPLSCVRCGEALGEAREGNCPRCGLPINASMVAASPPAGVDGPGDAQTAQTAHTAPMSGATMDAGGSPPAQWSYPAALAPDAPPAMPPGLFAAVPSAEPGMWQGNPPSMPLYPQPAPPSYPLYGQAPGQAAPPSVPLYGQPMYGQPLPPGYPLYAPGMPPGYPTPASPPARKSRMGLIIGIVAAALVAVLVTSVGVALALSHTTAASPAAQAQPTVGAQGTATVTPTPSERVIFQDPLTANTNGWIDDGTHCSIHSDGYHIIGAFICYAPTGSFGNVSVSVTTRQIAGPITEFYGLVLRRTSQGNYYKFSIDSNGKWRFSKVVNNTLTEILPFVPNSAIHQGANAVNTLKVRAIGSHFTFFVNGIEVGEADDSTFSAGLCGPDGAGSSEIVFTDFVVALPH